MNWYSKSSHLEKFASKEVLLHGTAYKNLPSILHQGLIPDPKERAWGTDPDESYYSLSMVSFPGIYLTQNFMTAYSAANRLERNRKGVIVCVQVETRTLATDEDNLTHRLRGSVEMMHKGYIMNEFLTKKTYLEYLKGNHQDIIERAANDFIDSVLGLGLSYHERKVQDEEKVEKYLRPALLPVSIKLVVALLKRNTVWSYKQGASWDKREMEEDFERIGQPIPDLDKTNQEFREALEEATRKFAIIARDPSKDFNFTARALTPISFSGANKILAIMSYEPKDPTDNYSKSVLKFWYGGYTDAERYLVSEWEQHVGKDYEVISGD